MPTTLLNDYEVRDVNYSIVHSETKENIAYLINTINIQVGEKMLDLGGGYGAILQKTIELKGSFSFHYHLLDGGQHQLKKAEALHKAIVPVSGEYPEVKYIHQHAPDIALPPNEYDVVLCKMFLHELPEADQQTIFNCIFSLLKPGGRLVIWAPHVLENNKDFYEKVIREKDRLAGFNNLVEKRFFALDGELKHYMKEAGFNAITMPCTFFYEMYTQNRLQEEFNGDENKLSAWNDYILGLLNSSETEQKEAIFISNQNNNIHLRFNRAIYVAKKP